MNEIIKTKNLCYKKLKEYFGELEFHHLLYHTSERECIFVTICNRSKDNNREFGVFRAYRENDVVYLHRELEHSVNLTSDLSIMVGIQFVIQEYEMQKKLSQQEQEKEDV